REDCGDRGATLLLPRDRDELEFLNETLQKHTRHFWIGLWVPAAGMGWMWVNGSCLDWDRFQLDLEERPGLCGTIRGSTIIPDNCDLDSQWVSQREATKL
ncbi:KRBBA protein, partial [Eulacestoma nigropectus]|nr:KRBBA protein [Eulacestoma nigropectus]NXB37911.1 KRBBA protein [Eulacestoma nigropectus]